MTETPPPAYHDSAFDPPPGAVLATETATTRAPAPPVALSALSIRNGAGRTLLTFTADGQILGDPADSAEAIQILVRDVTALSGLPIVARPRLAIPDHAVDNASRPWDPTDDTAHEHQETP